RPRLPGGTARHVDPHRLAGGGGRRDSLVVAPGRGGGGAPANVLHGVRGRPPKGRQYGGRSRGEAGGRAPAREERGASRDLPPLAEPSQLDRLDLVGGSEPGGLEILRRWGIRPDQRLVVDRRVGPADHRSPLMPPGGSRWGTGTGRRRCPTG